MHDTKRKARTQGVAGSDLLQARQLMSEALQLIKRDPELESAARELRLALNAINAPSTNSRNGD